MKIAIIVPSLRPLAPVQVAISIGLQLARKGHGITVYHFSSPQPWPDTEEIHFERINFWTRVPWRQYDIVHSHGFVPDAFVAFRKPSRSDARTIATLHNYVFAELKLLYGWLPAQVIGTAWLLAWSGMDQLVVLTDDALQYYRTYFKSKRITRIYNGKNIIPNHEPLLTKHVELIEDMRAKYEYVIGTSSALIKRKKIDILIRHLSRIPIGCLVIIGEGPERKHLEKLADHLEVSDRVKFLGYVERAHEYLPRMDIFAHPSVSEGFSLSLIEAALYKKKIVCSDIPSFKEAFDSTEVTFFDRENEQAIDHAIKVALHDLSKPEHAFQKAVSYYSEERMGEEYEKLFQQLLISKA